MRVNFKAFEHARLSEASHSAFFTGPWLLLHLPLVFQISSRTFLSMTLNHYPTGQSLPGSQVRASGTILSPALKRTLLARNLYLLA